MEAAPFTFAAGAAPPLDLSLDEIIKQRKKSEPKKAKPGAAKATPGKKSKPQAVVRARCTRLASRTSAGRTWFRARRGACGAARSRAAHCAAVSFAAPRRLPCTRAAQRRPCARR